MDIFNEAQDKFQSDPQQQAVYYLKEIHELIKRISDDVNRIKDDVDKIKDKVK